MCNHKRFVFKFYFEHPELEGGSFPLRWLQRCKNWNRPFWRRGRGRHRSRWRRLSRSVCSHQCWRLLLMWWWLSASAYYHQQKHKHIIITSHIHHIITIIIWTWCWDGLPVNVIQFLHQAYKRLPTYIYIHKAPFSLITNSGLKCYCCISQLIIFKAQQVNPLQLYLNVSYMKTVCQQFQTVLRTQLYFNFTDRWSCHDEDGEDEEDDGGNQVEGTDDAGAGLQGGAPATVWKGNHLCQQISLTF